MLFMMTSMGMSLMLSMGLPEMIFLHDFYFLNHIKSSGMQFLTIWPLLLQPEIRHIMVPKWG